MKTLFETIRSKTVSENQKLTLILIIGLLHGLIYVFVTPPWWHHDEPGHFQVAWFIANHDRRPEWGEYDNTMRVELVESLAHHHLFDYINYSPDSDANIPPWVLAPQALDPPLYYAVASLPLRLLKNTPLDLQNRVLRLLSLGFFLIFLWVSWALAGELFGVTHRIRTLGTAFLALLPGFVNEMTAVSNEPPVTLIFAVFLLAGVRLLRHGFSWKQFIILGISVIAGYYTKNTVWIAVGVLTAFIFLFISFRKRLKWFPWVILLVATVLLPLLIFQWGDARYWYRNMPVETKTRQINDNAPFGDYVLFVSKGSALRQRIPAGLLKPLRTKTLTLGFWAWASEPVSIIAPQVIFSTEQNFSNSPPQTIELSTEANFYSFSMVVPENSGRGWLKINSATAEGVNASVYFDGIVLAEGAHSLVAPEFTDKFVSAGTWGEAGFENLIRNGSSEYAWLSISPLAWGKGLGKFSTYFSTSSLATIQDWQSSGWYFKRTLIVLNETFWGRFGPSTVPMLGSPYIYQFLRIVGMFGLLGASGLTLVKFKSVDKSLLFFWGLSIIIIWGQTLLRGAGTIDSLIPVVPWTRYALPAILPTVMALCTGWYLLISKTEEALNIYDHSLQLPVFIAFMLSLDFLSILTMLQFFYLQTQWTYLVLFIALFSSVFALLFLSKKTRLTARE